MSAIAHLVTAAGRAPARRRRIVITGGAGFIGTNLAARLAGMNREVVIYDSLRRPGVERNLAWLRDRYKRLIAVEVADIRDRHALRAAVAQADEIYHLAAQVAVTTSLEAPELDFAVNAEGTLNLLEEIRRTATRPSLVFTSTNKVYGGLADVPLLETETRYEPADRDLARFGIGETRPLAFCSPYGCSKGAADQYVLDYANTFGLPAAVFRMSCIYGPHQCGNEDQGWVAHFLIQALEQGEVAIFGDGKQVRDLLHVDDLVDALLLAQRHMAEIGGQPFNIGGGPANSASLVEVIRMIREANGSFVPRVSFGPWRAADQRFYVSDTRRFSAATGWRSKVGLRSGIAQLHRWLAADRGAPLPRAAEGVAL